MIVELEDEIKEETETLEFGPKSKRKRLRQVSGLLGMMLKVYNISSTVLSIILRYGSFWIEKKH